MLWTEPHNWCNSMTCGLSGGCLVHPGDVLLFLGPHLSAPVVPLLCPFSCALLGSLPDAMMAVYVDSLCYMGHFKEALGVAALPESKDLAAKLQERVNSKLKEARDQLLFE